MGYILNGVLSASKCYHPVSKYVRIVILHGWLSLKYFLWRVLQMYIRKSEFLCASVRVEQGIDREKARTYILNVSITLHYKVARKRVKWLLVISDVKTVDVVVKVIR